MRISGLRYLDKAEDLGRKLRDYGLFEQYEDAFFELYMKLKDKSMSEKKKIRINYLEDQETQPNRREEKRKKKDDGDDSIWTGVLCPT